ncbi:hypothetical protein TGP89_238380 [Toxoplasma gondii p89]|uniref:Uncharacterized protein n=2 Tax=Toxoplasma gondii TaxID=5811 RepID=A0A2T6INU0_TOXGO|nr:hypothetical protein TGP89_238380 [Toxoplasma gondii p89]PUA87000.1 hypothetical protein TGBR9_238380 [Toxoplasma gondii TgCATBr9]
MSILSSVTCNTARSSASVTGGKNRRNYPREMIRLRPGHYRRFAAGNRFALYDVFFACSVCHRPPPYRVVDAWPSDPQSTSRKARKHSFKKAASQTGAPPRRATSNRYFPPAGSAQVPMPPSSYPEPPMELPPPEPVSDRASPPTVADPEPENPAPATHVKRSKWSLKGRKSLKSKLTGADGSPADVSRSSVAGSDPQSRTLASKLLSRSLFGSDAPKRTGTLSTGSDGTPPDVQSVRAAEAIPLEPPKLSPPGETRGPPTLRHTLSRKKSDKGGEPAQKIVVTVGALKGMYKGELEGQAQLFLLCGTTQDNLEQLLNHVRNKSPLIPFTLPSSGAFAVDFKHEFVLPLGDPPPPGMRVSVVCTRETTRVDQDGKKRFSWRLNDVGSIVSPFRDMTTSQTVDWDVYPLKLNKQSGFEAENVVLEAKFSLCPDSSGPPVPPDEIEAFTPPKPRKAKIKKEAKHQAAAPVDVPRLHLAETATDVEKRKRHFRLSTKSSKKDEAECREVSSRPLSESSDALSLRSSSSIIERLERALREHSASTERLNQFLEEYQRRKETSSRSERKRVFDTHVRPYQQTPESVSSLSDPPQNRRYGDDESVFSGRTGADAANQKRTEDRDVYCRQEKLSWGSSTSSDGTFRLTRRPSQTSKREFSDDAESEGGPQSRVPQASSCHSNNKTNGAFRVKGNRSDGYEAFANTEGTRGEKKTSDLQRSSQSDSRQSGSREIFEATKGGFSRARKTEKLETFEDFETSELDGFGVFGTSVLHAPLADSSVSSLSISPASSSRSREPCKLYSARVATLKEVRYPSDRGIAGREVTVKGMRRFPPPKRSGGKQGSGSGIETPARESDCVRNRSDANVLASRRCADSVYPRISPQRSKHF